MKINKTTITDYPPPYLLEEHRVPSKGGNRNAWHSHKITIGNEAYSFLALGYFKWIFAKDAVEFEWEWSSDVEPRYRNIIPSTIMTWDKKGNAVVRGNRGKKAQLRAVREPYLPAIIAKQERLETMHRAKDAVS